MPNLKDRDSEREREIKSGNKNETEGASGGQEMRK